MRRRAKPAKAKIKAKRGVVRGSRQNESSRDHELEKRLAEALEQLQTRNRELVEAQKQQTATGEILRVISTSPTHLQPVLDAVVKSAARFCGAYDATGGGPAVLIEQASTLLPIGVPIAGAHHRSVFPAGWFGHGDPFPVRDLVTPVLRHRPSFR